MIEYNTDCYLGWDNKLYNCPLIILAEVYGLDIMIVCPIQKNLVPVVLFAEKKLPGTSINIVAMRAKRNSSIGHILKDGSLVKKVD
jgi:hypothetical protein